MLDSARTIGSNLNMTLGRSKNTSAGVHWYALRATYSRELKVQNLLNGRGIRTFVPMMWRPTSSPTRSAASSSTRSATSSSTRSATSSPTRSGIPRKLVPAVNNLCFAYATKDQLDDFIRSFGDASPVHYYWDRTAGRPLTIPEKAMEDFITVASSLDEDLIYLTEISEKLREGQIVEVVEGPFKGVRGKIVRIKKNRRVLVELPGFLAVTTNYLSPLSIKMAEEKEL